MAYVTRTWCSDFTRRHFLQQSKPFCVSFGSCAATQASRSDTVAMLNDAPPPGTKTNRTSTCYDVCFLSHPREDWYDLFIITHGISVYLYCNSGRHQLQQDPAPKRRPTRPTSLPLWGKGRDAQRVWSGQPQTPSPYLPLCWVRASPSQSLDHYSASARPHPAPRPSFPAHLPLTSIDPASLLSLSPAPFTHDPRRPPSPKRTLSVAFVDILTKA